MKHISAPPFIAACFALTLAAGCSDPDPQNGTVVCAATSPQCPDGYACVARTNTCWKGGIDLGADGGPRSDAAAWVDAPQSFDSRSGVDVGQGGPETSHDAVGIDVQSPDAPAVETSSPPDAPGVDAPAPADSAALDQAAPQDGPGPAIDTAPACPSPKVLCSDGACIDPSVGCCAATDCKGSCMTCSNHTCAAVKGQDDPTLRCTGSCDSAGVCKAKRGQTCTGNADCANAICADGYCCDKACTGTCEACDLAASQGTCKPIASGDNPRASRTACTGTGTCAGTCNGASAECSYPAGNCGAAACSSSGYQAAGTCNLGTCKMPPVTACSFACDAGQGGCTGVCQPSARQCTNAGVPQTCSSSGAWQDQAACQGLAVCDKPTGACVCQSPNTTCGATCVNLDTDPKNCGTCGHDCLGGTCSAGLCQPVPITVNLAGATRLFGQDASNLYFSLPSTTQMGSNDAYRVGKTANNVNGTVVYANPNSLSGIDSIVGATLFLYDAVGKLSSYIIGQSTVAGPTGQEGYGVPLFKVTSALPRYYAQYATDASNNLNIQWFDPVTHASKGTASQPLNLPASASSYSFANYAIGGDTVYWARLYTDQDYSPIAGSGYYSATPTAPSPKQIAGGTNLKGLSVVDVNDLSMLLSRYPDGYLFRIPLPAGKGTGDPDSVVSIASGGVAVEDAKGVYWIGGDDGNLYRCAPVNCAASRTTLATGVGPAAALLQDATALYWVPSASNRIYRIAK